MIQGYGYLYFASSEHGIYRSRTDAAWEEIADPILDVSAHRSFFVAAHPSKPVLYSIDLWAGAISAYRAGDHGRLSLLNRRSTRGEAPCHLAVEARGVFMIVTNYKGGVVLIPLEDDGSLGEVRADMRFEGKGPHPIRQTASHPHGVALGCLGLGPFAYVADLGTDRIDVVEIEPATLQMTLRPGLGGSVPPGGGPRHFLFDPSGRRAIAVNELASSITIFNCDAGTGAIRPLETVQTVSAKYEEPNTTAEGGFHPTLPVAYVTNRGHDSLAVVAFANEGTTRLQSCVPAGGSGPQHLLVNSGGKKLLLANTNSDQVAVFNLCTETGEPMAMDKTLTIARPMCMAYIALHR